MIFMQQGRNVSARLVAIAQLALRIQDSLATKCGPKDRLAKPRPLGDETCLPRRDVVLSIHPKYSEEILKKRKTVELRRRFPEQSGIILYIYSTSPKQAIVGVAGIKEVRKLPVKQIWTEFKENALIKPKDFKQYFQGLEFGFVLILDGIRPFAEPIPLRWLREEFGFEPPQSFLYVKKDLHEALHTRYGQ